MAEEDRDAPTAVSKEARLNTEMMKDSVDEPGSSNRARTPHLAL
jgi:hypothetical protein